MEPILNDRVFILSKDIVIKTNVPNNQSSSYLPNPNIVWELDVVMLGNDSPTILSKVTGLDLVRDLGDFQRPLQFVERRHVQVVVFRDAGNVKGFVDVALEGRSKDADRLPAIPMEQIQEFVVRLVVVTSYHAVVVSGCRTVFDHERGKWKYPIPRS